MHLAPLVYVYTVEVGARVLFTAGKSQDSRGRTRPLACAPRLEVPEKDAVICLMYVTLFTRVESMPCHAMQQSNPPKRT